MVILLKYFQKNIFSFHANEETVTFQSKLVELYFQEKLKDKLRKSKNFNEDFSLDAQKHSEE